MPVHVLTLFSRRPHAMKPPALLLALFLVGSPGYGLYHNSVKRQSDQRHAETLDSGELFVDSATAMMRARFCQFVYEPGQSEPMPSLIGVEGMVLSEGDSGPQFVCAPDGTTVKQRNGEFAEYAAVAEKDLAKFHRLLIVRGMATEKYLKGFQIYDSQ